MDRHLTEQAVEALAQGRDDLVDESNRAHARTCATCAVAIDEARALASATTTRMREASPPLPDLDAMVSAALAAVPVAAEAPAESAETIVVQRPSRIALAIAAAVAALAALGLRLASMGGVPSVASVITSVQNAVHIGAAVNRVVGVVVPGGWVTLSGAGVLVLLLVGLPLRRLVRMAPLPLPVGPVTGMLTLAAMLAVLAAHAPTAHALDFQGDWPAHETRVTVSVDHQPASVALRKAAESAGLDLVATLPSDPDVNVHVHHASLRDVVQAVLGDAPVVAERTGNMLILRPAAGAGGTSAPSSASGTGETAPTTNTHANGSPAADTHAGSANAPGGAATADAHGQPNGPHPVPEVIAPQADPDSPPAPPAAASDGPVHDRVSFGGDVTVHRGERVHDVVTMGGDAKIAGKVLGDVVTMGGDIHVLSGGSVLGSVVTMGGKLKVDDGAQVVGTRTGMGGHHHGMSLRLDDGGSRVPHTGSTDDDCAPESGLGAFLHHALGSASEHALLFLLGLVLLGMSPDRFAALQRTMVRSPVRAGATGVLSFIAASVLSIVLVITLIGIPAAVVVVLGVAVGAYIGIVATASIVGGALPVAALRNRPLLQLAAGVALLFVASLVPVVGTIVGIAAAIFGFGAVVLTRFSKRAPGDPPTTSTGAA